MPILLEKGLSVTLILQTQERSTIRVNLRQNAIKGTNLGLRANQEADPKVVAREGENLKERRNTVEVVTTTAMKNITPTMVQALKVTKILENTILTKFQLQIGLMCQMQGGNMEREATPMVEVSKVPEMHIWLVNTAEKKNKVITIETIAHLTPNIRKINRKFTLTVSRKSVRETKAGLKVRVEEHQV